MASTLAQQYDRWRSGKHVGAAKPTLRAFVRRGKLVRHYENLADEHVFCYVPGTKGPNAVWYATWQPLSDYKEIPNVLTAKGDTDFGQNGVENCQVEIDNVFMEEHSGVAGLFHRIKRGYFAPARGDRGWQGMQPGTVNPWHGLLDDQVQVQIVAGYGDEYFPLGPFLLDKADFTSRPDRITLTLRNMGKFLTDQHTFMDAKNLWTQDPITFCDRQHADDLSDQAKAPHAKSSNNGHPAAFATDGNDNSTWLSSGYDDATGRDWIEVTLPAGRYEDFNLFPSFPGMNVYVSLYAKNGVPGGGVAHATDGPQIGEGWVTYAAKGQVPATDIPYISFIGQAGEKDTRYRIRGPQGGGYVVGDGSRLRLWFTNLHQAPDKKRWTYRAGVRSLQVWQRKKMQEAKDDHWILVDDVSDIIKTVCQWAGFYPIGNSGGFEVESVGVRLSDKLVFDRQTFLIDIIRRIAELVSYVTYIKPPETFDVNDLSAGNPTNKSMGTVVFRQNNAMKSNPREPIQPIRESDLLTGIQASLDHTVLANSIRSRGRNVNKTKALKDPEHIHKNGADRIRRFHYSYRPVWARVANGFDASLRKQAVHYDEQLDSVFECKVMCLFIAFREAMEAWKAQIQFPFWPLIHLDHQVSVFDEGTGLATRIWVAMRNWEYRSGEQAAFNMTVGGALLDVPFVEQTRQELVQLLGNHGWDPAPIARGPWTNVHYF